jgi:hypothetical protein
MESGRHDRVGHRGRGPEFLTGRRAVRTVAGGDLDSETSRSNVASLPAAAPR